MYLTRVYKYFQAGRKGVKWKYLSTLKTEQHIHFETDLIFKALNTFKR